MEVKDPIDDDLRQSNGDEQGPGQVPQAKDQSQSEAGFVFTQHNSHPLMQITGSSLATFDDSFAACAASTTAQTSLYKVRLAHPGLPGN